MAPRTRQIAGIATMAISIVLFFWWGVHFQLFGNPIRLSLPMLGFFGWILLGFFGAGLSVQGWQAGLMFSVGVSVFFALAGLVGVLKRALD